MPLAVAGSVAAMIIVAVILLSVGLVVLDQNYRQLETAESREREANIQLAASLEETLQAKDAAERSQETRRIMRTMLSTLDSDPAGVQAGVSSAEGEG